MESLPSSVLKRVVKDLLEIENDPIEGVTVVYHDEDLSQVHAFLEGPQGTPYQFGCFHIQLMFGADFPEAPPKGHFVTKIFHPNMSTSGEICVNTLKKDWKKEFGIKHILLTIKCLLIVPNAESALNEEAGRLLLEQYDEYAKHAKLMTDIHAKKNNVYKNASTQSRLSMQSIMEKENEQRQKSQLRKDKENSEKLNDIRCNTTLCNVESDVMAGIAMNVVEKKPEVDKKKTLRRL